jgi:hypothetical protein
VKRWNVEKIIFYSHDERSREIVLVPGAVNIITGDSHTGKSGIAEVIDYVMGASVCHIPGVIRDATSWVGMLWVSEGSQYLMCRRLPPPNQATSTEYHVEVGAKLVVPTAASALKSRATRAAAMRKFEQLLGIGAVESEVLASQRAPARITTRHLMPYLLQDDEHILSKVNILRGAGDEHRQSIIDTLPYFLGVVDERSYAEQTVLERLRGQLELEQRQIETQRRIVEQSAGSARVLVEEARQVGLLATADDGAAQESNEEPIALLRTLVLTMPFRTPSPMMNGFSSCMTQNGGFKNALPDFVRELRR